MNRSNTRGVIGRNWGVRHKRDCMVTVYTAVSSLAMCWVAEAADEVVLHYADCLEMCVDDGWTKKFEPPFFHVRGNCYG